MTSIPAGEQNSRGRSALARLLGGLVPAGFFLALLALYWATLSPGLLPADAG